MLNPNHKAAEQVMKEEQNKSKGSSSWISPRLFGGKKQAVPIEEAKSFEDDSVDHHTDISKKLSK